MEENSLENIGCANEAKENCNCAACEEISLGVLGREGEEGTTELGDGGVLGSRGIEGSEEGEHDGELSGTGEEGSERHEDKGDEDKEGVNEEEEDKDGDGESISSSMSNDGDIGGWKESDDLPRPRFTFARLF